MSKSKPYSVEEMRQMFMDGVIESIDYWRTCDLSRPEFQEAMRKQGIDELQYRFEGAIFSLFVLLDGGTFLPSFDVIPSPHPDDRQDAQEHGEQWWQHKVINDCQLHEIYSMRGKEDGEPGPIEVTIDDYQRMRVLSRRMVDVLVRGGLRGAAVEEVTAERAVITLPFIKDGMTLTLEVSGTVKVSK